MRQDGNKGNAAERQGRKGETIMGRKKPAVLMILDGYGLNEKTEGNAVALAKTPVMDKLMTEYPFVKGNASGMAVGDRKSTRLNSSH